MLCQVGDDVGAGEGVELEHEHGVTLEGVHQRHHLLVLQSLQILELTLGRLVALGVGLVKQLAGGSLLDQGHTVDHV